MVDYSKYTTMKVERKEKIAIITLNRPEVMNAIAKEGHTELINIFVDLDKDEEVNAAIITGAGRAFSAGGDIEYMKAIQKDPSVGPKMHEPKQLIENLVALRKPIIAAINGPCTGLGSVVALHCDIILAAENVRIGDLHVGVGMVAGDGGCVIGPLQMSMCKAKELLMGGGMVKAEDAERLGMINKVVPQDKLMEEAWKWAKQFADGAIQAIIWTKVLLNKIIQERVNLIMDASIAFEYHSMRMEDHQEAVKAFLEKRSPKFTGKQL